MSDTLPALIQNQAKAQPTKTAIADVYGRRLTYAEVAQHLRDTAAAVRELGAGPRDRVAIVLPNGPDAALSFLGVATAATAAPLNPNYGQEEFEFYLQDLGAKLVLLDPAAAPAAAAAASKLGIQTSGFPLPKPTTGANTIEPSADAVALVLHTSGTTSRPKIVPLTHANLTASATNIVRSLALTPEDCALNVMPLFHIHGLVAAVLATLGSGGTVVCTPGFDASQFFQWLDEHEATWYTAVPTMHQAILGQAAQGQRKNGRSRLRFARSCSSALAPKLMAELEAALGIPVIEAYGMTEAAHQMACNPLPPRPRKPGSVGVATGVEIAIMDETGRLLEPGQTGEIVIRGPNVTAGYASPPEANATAFVDGWFRTGDQGSLDADGYLSLTGRLKEIINRGGEKISPREIDEALLEHPAIGQAVAFAIPHPTLGEDVGVAVVPRAGANVTPQEVRAFAFEHLADFKVPSVAVIVDTIPKGPTGKLQRIGLAEKLKDHLRAEYDAPADTLESIIADAWGEILGRKQVGAGDNFFALGGDSLRGGRMVAQIADIFDVDLNVPVVFRNPVLRDFANVVRAACRPERLAEIEEALAELDSPKEERV